MGIEDDRFLYGVRESEKCGLCRRVLDNPLSTPCKQVFCASCVLPLVIQNARCPAKDCGSPVSPSDLTNVPELRNSILSKQVRCKYVKNGCKEVTQLVDQQRHLETCLFRPVVCNNQGCSKVTTHKDLNMHEGDSCDFRPVGICQDGCGMIILQKDKNQHNCIHALQNHISIQEVKISTLYNDLRTLVSRHESRENALMSKINNLHNEILDQAQSFQKKLKDYINRVAYLSKKINSNQGLDDVTLSLPLERCDNSLGFSIMGGYLNGNEEVDSIIVTDIVADSLAHQTGMMLHDQIIKVSVRKDVFTALNMKIHPLVSVPSSLNSQDYVLPKSVINGQDLTNSSHEQAIQAFQTAKEPIIVEVLRRVAKGSGDSPCNLGNKMKSRMPLMVTTATQTDQYVEDTYINLFQPPPPPFGMCAFENMSLVEPSSRQGIAYSPTADMGLTDLEMANGLEYDDDYDVERAFDMEYEEVTLHRRSSKEKIGLTLCYGNTEDEITDIFISEVEPYSIAAQDGRIREGDQILQINSTDVLNREQAIQLFSENKSDITLLLARPQVVPMEDGFLDERGGLEGLQALEALDSHGRKHLDFTAAVFAQGQEEEGGTTDTATTENSHKHDKDSGVGRTDDSTKNEESSEQELMEAECTSPSNQGYVGGLGDSSELHYSNDSFTSNDMSQDADVAAEECNKFREVLETRCASQGASSSSTDTSPHKHSNNNHLLLRKDSQSSIEREIAALNQEMEQIQIECQEIVEAHTRESHRNNKQLDSASKGAGSAMMAGGDLFRSPRMVPRMGTRLDYLKQLHALHDNLTPAESRQEHLAKTNPAVFQAMATDPSSSGVSTMDSNIRKGKDPKDKDNSTSAYNTGDSCRSTPLTLELHQASDDSSKGHKSSMLCLAAPTTMAAQTKPSHSDSERLIATGAKCRSKEWNSDGDARANLSKSQSNSSVSKMSQTQDTDNVNHLQEVYSQYAEVMYTNEANLQHTIMVQQKLFQQQLMQRAAMKKGQSVVAEASAGGNSTTASSPTVTGAEGSLGSPTYSMAHHIYETLQSPSKTDGNVSSCNASGSQMEWVVKRRADGSRYITRRPTRSKILKERAKKICEERCGLTTDDDAVSEMKVGRYWSKEDRKRHIEKAKDHRRRKEIMLRSKMETVKEGEETQGSPKKEPNIVELSHRKMMKHKGKKVFDDFTTLQEMLAHGSREPQGKNYNPLLSVTTV